MHSNLLFPNFEMQYFQPESYSDLIMSDLSEPPNKFGMDKDSFKSKNEKRLQPDNYLSSHQAANTLRLSVTQKLLYVK